MTFEEWLGDKHLGSMELEFSKDAFQAGAASRDAYIERLETGLLQVRKALCGDIHNTDDLLDLIASRDAEVARLKTVPMRYRRMAFNAQLQDEVEELVAALEHSVLYVPELATVPGIAAALAKVRKP